MNQWIFESDQANGIRLGQKLEPEKMKLKPSFGMKQSNCVEKSWSEDKIDSTLVDAAIYSRFSA